MHNWTRRQFMTALPAIGLAAWSAPVRADALLKETDQEALAMDYHADAAKVDAAKSPKYKPGQTCTNCALYFGDKGAASGACSLFMGKDVTAIGWCNAWEPK
ncbi:MAG: high-potential iron-sulfur protein [Burkholderiales bacterium]|nr:high-potential iron-sulfur protein [Burkholderiales bacterium]